MSDTEMTRIAIVEVDSCSECPYFDDLEPINRELCELLSREISLDERLKKGFPDDCPLDNKGDSKDNCEICKGAKGGVPGNENIIDGKAVCDYCHANNTRTNAKEELIEKVKNSPAQYWTDESGGAWVIEVDDVIEAIKEIDK